jgi:hypothetical protein
VFAQLLFVTAPPGGNSSRSTLTHFSAKSGFYGKLPPTSRPFAHLNRRLTHRIDFVKNPPLRRRALDLRPQRKLRRICARPEIELFPAALPFARSAIFSGILSQARCPMQAYKPLAPTLSYFTKNELNTPVAVSPLVSYLVPASAKSSILDECRE